LFSLLCLLNGFTVFFPSEWSIADFMSAYIGIPLFVAVYLVHRLIKRTDPWAISSELVDLHTGLAEMEAMEEPEKPHRPLRDRLRDLTAAVRPS
jgi:yeast amino acid transporter